MNALQQLADYGQAPWLDYIRRHLITSGELQRLIDEEGLKGMTSNPAIFEKALSAGDDYQDFIVANAASVKDALELYERIAIRDIQDAADILRSVYDATNKRDGYISLEVSPTLAHDTDKTIAEAQRLWRAVNRPNLMVKVPATAAGIPAIEFLIGEGININVTLLFAQDAYASVADAYLAGLEKHATQHADIGHVASVASFFVSRIDSLVDAQIEAKLKDARDADKQLLERLQGQVAIANAKLAYQIYRQKFAGARWDALAQKGAQSQRVLWASTGTKNPLYRDTLYVEELIGADTVNTIPPATWNAFREHGQVRASLTENINEAAAVIANLERAGISLAAATDELLQEAVRLFVEPFEKMIAAVAKAMEGHRQ